MENSARLRLREVKGVATLDRIEGDFELVCAVFAALDGDLMTIDPLRSQPFER